MKVPWGTGNGVTVDWDMIRCRHFASGLNFWNVVSMEGCVSDPSLPQILTELE